MNFRNSHQAVFSGRGQEAYNLITLSPDGVSAVYLFYGQSHDANFNLTLRLAGKLLHTDTPLLHPDIAVFSLNTLPPANLPEIEKFSDFLYAHPIRASVRIGIITDADSLEIVAVNRLLKVISKNPPNTYIFLTSMTKSSIHPAIMSKAIPVPLRTFDNSDILALRSDAFSLLTRTECCLDSSIFADEFRRVAQKHEPTISKRLLSPDITHNCSPNEPTKQVITVTAYAAIIEQMKTHVVRCLIKVPHSKRDMKKAVIIFSNAISKLKHGVDYDIILDTMSICIQNIDLSDMKSLDINAT